MTPKSSWCGSRRHSCPAACRARQAGDGPANLRSARPGPVHTCFCAPTTPTPHPQTTTTPTPPRPPPNPQTNWHSSSPRQVRIGWEGTGATPHLGQVLEGLVRQLPQVLLRVGQVSQQHDHRAEQARRGGAARLGHQGCKGGCRWGWGTHSRAQDVRAQVELEACRAWMGCRCPSTCNIPQKEGRAPGAGGAAAAAAARGGAAGSGRGRLAVASGNTNCLVIAAQWPRGAMIAIKSVSIIGRVQHRSRR